MAAAAVLAMFLVSPSSVYAQDAKPVLRDPMKPAANGNKTGDQDKVKVSEHNTVTLHLKDEELANVLELALDPDAEEHHREQERDRQSHGLALQRDL